MVIYCCFAVWAKQMRWDLDYKPQLSRPELPVNPWVSSILLPAWLSGSEQPCSLLMCGPTALQLNPWAPHVLPPLQRGSAAYAPAEMAAGVAQETAIRSPFIWSDALSAGWSHLNQWLLKKEFHSLQGHGSHLSPSSDTLDLHLYGCFLMPDVMLARLASQKNFSGFRGTVLALCSAGSVCLPQAGFNQCQRHWRSAKEILPAFIFYRYKPTCIASAELL